MRIRRIKNNCKLFSVVANIANNINNNNNNQNDNNLNYVHQQNNNLNMNQNIVNQEGYIDRLIAFFSIDLLGTSKV